MGTNAVEFDFTGRRLQDSAIKWLVVPILIGFALPYGALMLEAVTGSGSYGQFFEWFMQTFQLDQSALSGQPWRFVTYMFLHGGLVHLLFNTMALLSLYFLAKAQFPKYAWLFIFFISGISGGFCEVLLNPNARGVVGASAGVFGLWGAALAAAWRYKRGESEERPWGNERNFQMLTKWLVINFILGLVIAAIAKFAHAGGLIVGLALGMLYPIGGQPRLLATRPGLFLLVAYKKTPETKSNSGPIEPSYFTWVKLVPTGEFDPARDALIAEYDQFDWQGNRKVRYELVAGTTPKAGLQELYEVATPLRIEGVVNYPFEARNRRPETREEPASDQA
jgi:membrane associated rhomboid family serine protease